MSLDLGRISDPQLKAVGRESRSGTRLSHQNAQLLFTTPDLLGVGIALDYANPPQARRRRYIRRQSAHKSDERRLPAKDMRLFVSFARLPKEEERILHARQVYAERRRRPAV